MSTLLTIIHITLAFMLIGLVLIQQGKGAEAGASFGGGASNTVFGSQGSGSFLAKATIFIALGLVITSLAIPKLTAQSIKNKVIPIEEIENIPSIPAPQ